MTPGGRQTAGPVVGRGEPTNKPIFLRSQHASMDKRLESFLRSKLRSAGRQYADAKKAYQSARAAALAEVPQDREGRARIVCRRHAEKRAVGLDTEARPECFDADHPDCQGCVEDLREGRIETWEFDE